MESISHHNLKYSLNLVKCKLTSIKQSLNQEEVKQRLDKTSCSLKTVS